MDVRAWGVVNPPAGKQLPPFKPVPSSRKREGGVKIKVKGIIYLLFNEKLLFLLSI